MASASSCIRLCSSRLSLLNFSRFAAYLLASLISSERRQLIPCEISLRRPAALILGATEKPKSEACSDSTGRFVSSSIAKYPFEQRFLPNSLKSFTD